MQIDIHCVWHTDYEWSCNCGKENLESEGQLDLDDGNYIYIVPLVIHYIA